MTIANTISKIFVATILSMAAVSAQANLLANSGFESPDLADGGEVLDVPGWSYFGAAFTVDEAQFIPAKEGTQYLRAFGVSGAFQEFAVTGGTDYVYGEAYVATPSADPIGDAVVSTIVVEWFDAVGNQIEISFGTGFLKGEVDIWKKISVNDLAPVSATLARVVLITGDFLVGTDRFGSTLFDDASVIISSSPQPPDDATDTVTVVPVPAAVWLYGSGILTMIGFARRY